MTTMPAPSTPPAPIGANVVPKRAGLGVYGLYLEVIEYWKHSGEVRAHHFYFLAQNTLSMSVRQGTNKQARWTIKDHGSYDAAATALTDRIARLEAGRLGAELRGHPVLIEMTPLDFEKIREGEAPTSPRVTGRHNIDEKVGKFIAEEWKPTPKEEV